MTVELHRDFQDTFWTGLSTFEAVEPMLQNPVLASFVLGCVGVSGA